MNAGGLSEMTMSAEERSIASEAAALAIEPNVEAVDDNLNERQVVELFEKARVAELSGQFELSISLWRRLRELFPEDWRGYGPSARLASTLGRFDEAQTLIDEARAKKHR